MKKILLGVSSSVSIYKACEVVRSLVNNGYDVHTVMTQNAAELIRPLLFESITGNPVFCDMYKRDSFSMKHIELKKGASLLAVVPASADIIGKTANGIADDLLTTTFLSVECPVIMAPAMNPAMWSNEAVKHNIKILSSRGIIIIPPCEGTVACGDTGTGKLASVNTIVETITKTVG